MNIEQKETNLLINEWQLGQQLNTAVHNGTREKFNLLLSFLSDDARDFGQFSLPEGEKGVPPEDRSDLRCEFALREAQPLVNQGMSVEQARQLNENLEQDNLSSIRLQLLLNNEAILSRSDDLLIDSEIRDNLPFLTQQRLDINLRADKAGCSEQQEQINQAAGVNHQLMEAYQALDLDSKPIKVNYM